MEILNLPKPKGLRLGDSLTLCPVGDLQLGSEGADLVAFERHVEWCLSQPNPWFIGMGDYVDVASPSNRAALRATRLYDSVEDALEEITEEHRQRFLDVAAATKGRWIGFLEGHHYYQFRDGSTSDTRITKDMGGHFLGTSALITFPLGGEQELTVFATHGEGNGKSAAAPIQKLEKVAQGIRADVYIMGHMSKKCVAPIDELYSDNGELKYRTKVLVGAGGFSQGYRQGSHQAGVPRGSYVERGMMTPASLGAPLVHVYSSTEGVEIRAVV